MANDGDPLPFRDRQTLSPRKDDWSETLRKIRATTPARLLAGRVGAAYSTATQLELREAHAAAHDAVRAELNLDNFPAEFLKQWALFEVSSEANSKDEYLWQPNLGRKFSETSRAELLRRCPLQSDLQIAIGDGLSVTAVFAQVPTLLAALDKGAKARGWSVGQGFVIRHCRVGILNQIGELLKPFVAVLLIGERPGLATDDSLSAYMAYQPRRTQTDADRNVVSNIHSRGVSPENGAIAILDLAAQMMDRRTSGTKLNAEPSPKLGGR